MHLVHKNCSTQLFPWLLLTSKSRVPRETTALRRLSCTSHNRYFIYSATLFPKSSKQHAVENLGLLHLMPKPCCNSTTLQALVNNNKIQHLFGLHKTGCQWRQPYQAPGTGTNPSLHKSRHLSTLAVTGKDTCLP